MAGTGETPGERRHAGKEQTAEPRPQPAQRRKGTRREARLETDLDPHRAGAEEAGEEIELGAVPVVDGARPERRRQVHDLAATEAAEHSLRRREGTPALRHRSADGGLSLRIAVADEERHPRSLHGRQPPGSEDRQCTRDPRQAGAAHGGGEAALAEHVGEHSHPDEPAAGVRDVDVMDA